MPMKPVPDPQSDPPRDLSEGHTATPWRIGCGVRTAIIGADARFVCDTGSGYLAHSGLPSREANAAFIVKAVNAHDGLVKALRDLLLVAEVDLRLNPGPHPMRVMTVENAKAALAKLSEGLPTHQPETTAGRPSEVSP